MNHEWLSNENIKSVISNTLKDDGDLYFHLSTPLKVNFSAHVNELLLQLYDPKFEKGGILIGMVKETPNSEKFILIENITVIDNIHETPEIGYLYNREQRNRNIAQIFNEGKIPFLFHTHPTTGKDILIEHINFQKKFDISLEDEKASFYYDYRIDDNARLILPCVLVVGNGELSNSLLIGIFNGFIAPLEFEELKNKILQDRIGKTIEEFSMTDKEKRTIILCTILVLLLIGIIVFPKQTLMTLVLIGVLTPILAYALQENNIFFGMTHGQDLLIEIPTFEN